MSTGLDRTEMRRVENTSEVRANSNAKCEVERQKIQQAFFNATSVHETLEAPCEMAERNVQQGLRHASDVHNLEIEGLAVLAIGGFGRRLLFPYSDLHVLTRAHREFSITGKRRIPRRFAK